MAGIPTMEFLRDQLRRIRLARGLSQEDLARLINYSASLISAVELGHATPTRDYLVRVDAALDTGELFVHMLRLLRFHAGPSWFRPWEEMERAAASLRWYGPTLVPGLLQTEAYARAMLQVGAVMTPDEVEQRVIARLARQAVLTGDRPPQFVAVLDEMALRRQVGEPAVMREQLEHLVTAAGETHVQVRIVPADSLWYTGLSGPFILAKLADGTEAAYLDNQLRGEIIDGAHDLAGLGRRWEAVAGEALSQRQSVDLIKEVAKTWT